MEYIVLHLKTLNAAVSPTALIIGTNIDSSPFPVVLSYFIFYIKCVDLALLTFPHW
jgi:hypothetical protein